MTRIKYLLGSTVLLLALFTVTARADTFTFTQNNFNQPGNLGTVTTTLVGGSIQVSVNINPAYVIHNAGIGFNVAAGFGGITITNISPGSIFSADLTSHVFDGFGSFAFSLDSNQSAAQARATMTNTVTFTVNTTTAGGFTSAGQLTQFAAQLAPLDTNNMNTGFAATTPGGPPPPPPPGIPEPTTMILLGSGLVGLAAKLRRR